MGEHPQRVLLRVEGVGRRRRQAGKEPGETICEEGVARDRMGDLRRAVQILAQRLSHDAGIEVEHPPKPHVAPHGIAVVHLAGVDVAGAVLDVADAARRALCTGVQDADAEVVMGVPGEGAIGREREGLNA